MILTLIIFSGRVLSNHEKGLNNKKEILRNVERKKIDYNDVLEQKIHNYSKDKNELMNNKSKQVLQSYNISYKNIDKIEVIKDKQLNKIINRATLNSA